MEDGGLVGAEHGREAAAAGELTWCPTGSGSLLTVMETDSSKLSNLYCYVLLWTQTTLSHAPEATVASEAHTAPSVLRSPISRPLAFFTCLWIRTPSVLCVFLCRPRPLLRPLLHHYTLLLL